MIPLFSTGARRTVMYSDTRSFSAELLCPSLYHV